MLRVWLAVAWALVAAGCASARATGPLSGPALMRDVRELADPRYGGRAAGTEGERLAVAYVVERLRGLGLEPVEQEVPSYGSANVHATLVGARPDEVIVVGAHLDHLGMRGGKLHRGADDNASGVAVVLAIAEVLAARRDELERSVMFVLFGAEEQGLAGSNYFVEDPPVPLEHIVGMVNLDMVGRPLVDRRLLRPPLWLIGIDRDRATGLVGTRHYPGLRKLADKAFAAVGGELVAAEDLPDPIDDVVERASTGRSDATAFEERDIPALFFGDGEGRDYHSPRDTPGRLKPRVMARRARAIARVVLALSTAPAEAFTRSERRHRRRQPTRGLYLPLGFVTGAAFAPETSYFLGGEASLLYLRWPWYGGLYADAIRDTGEGVTRVSFGPELGRRLLGLDAGYVVELDDGEVTDRGVVVRAFFGISPLTVTVRAGYLDDGGGFAEVGIALKLPLRLLTSGR